jgi:D-alanyl-D-alanine carboxypeptidase (penicillin-binding protein 5/6)
MTTVYSKNITATQRPASTIKLMNALVFNDWIGSSDLSTTVDVTSADTVDWGTNSNAGLINGDILSYADLLYGSLLPSGNDAAKCIARNVGAIIIAASGPGSSSDAVTRFVEAMNIKAAELDLSTAVFADPFGMDPANTMSASDLAGLMLEFAQYPYLVTVGGTYTRGLIITGPNARTQNVTHTIDPDGTVAFPEFLSGKTGTVTYSGDPSLNSGGCCAMLWQSPLGVKRVSVVMGAEPPEQRFVDLRRMIDFELARLGEM